MYKNKSIRLTISFYIMQFASVVFKTIIVFLIRLDLIFSISLWKEFQLLQILNDLSIKHLINLILYENDVKLLKFKRSPV